jgi:hypothetical protein
MMTRLFLAAGVAALAIAMPASAKPGGGQGGGRGGDRAASVPNSGGGNAQARGGGGGGRAFRVENRGGGGGNAFRAANGGGGQRMQVQRAPRGGGFQMRSVERRSAAPRFEQRQMQRFATLQHGRSAAQVERRTNRGPVNTQRFERQQARNQTRNLERRQVGSNRMLERQQARNFDRRQMRENRIADRRDLRANSVVNVENRIATRDQLRGNRFEGGFRDRIITRDDIQAGRFARLEGRDAIGYGVGGCPPGLASKGCMPPGQAAKLLGTRLSDAGRFASLGEVPLSARYLYPDTNDYFYRYGDGYMYRVDRGDQLISALLPLAFGGGYSPGSYFPSSYMNDYYVPNYYGFNSFYPDSPYSCNRYVNGLVYQMDCASGYIDDVIPLYDSGYGVGQLLPTGAGYYNVPYQYRDMYYDTSDYGYWYAPGAIYQYDPSSSMITSVAALLSPGFSVGQQLPYGYDAYNVPYDYRATYYDTPDAYYRYNNGGIYRVDPTTMLVTALVASILT